MNCSPLGQWIINNTSFIVSMIYDLLKYFVCFPHFWTRMHMLMSHQSSAIKLVKFKNLECDFNPVKRWNKLSDRQKEIGRERERSKRGWPRWLHSRQTIDESHDNLWIANEKKPTNLCKWKSLGSSYLSLPLASCLLCLVYQSLVSFLHPIYS